LIPLTIHLILESPSDLVCDVTERMMAVPEHAALVKELNPTFENPKKPFKVGRGRGE
jgi:hypothetical protein